MNKPFTSAAALGRHLRQGLAALVLLPALACAAPPSDASLDRLFRLMQAEKLVDSIYAQIEPMMARQVEASMAGKPMGEQERQALQRVIARVSAFIRSEMSWARLEPLQRAVYRDSFDQTEIDGLIAFYDSPVGRSFLSKMPQVMQRTMAGTQDIMRDAMPRLQAEVQQAMAEAGFAPGR